MKYLLQLNEYKSAFETLKGVIQIKYKNININRNIQYFYEDCSMFYNKL